MLADGREREPLAPDDLLATDDADIDFEPERLCVTALTADL